MIARPPMSSACRRWKRVVLGWGLCLCLPTGVGAQAAPLYVGGASATALRLRQLDGVKRVLFIAAHPDDEDTSLLATLARGWGAEAAYLALTRGEGGQNLIGPELGEGLGLVRTGELLAARRLDGARQFFTRAFDYGYSKSAEEAFRHWPKDSVLADVVWVLRRFRPQVLVSGFSGTDRDGHGQHQAAGILAREAFEAAGDPTRFPEQLRDGVTTWRPLKLYRRSWRDPDSTTLQIATGTLDPVLGRSHFQLAMQSRSQHRSQDFGTVQPMGPRTTGLMLLASRGAEPEPGLFAGVDTTLAGLAARLSPADRATATETIRRYREELGEARGRLNALDPSAAVPALASALGRLLDLERRAAGLGEEADALRHELREKVRIANEALLAAGSIEWRVRADDDVVVPGQLVTVTAELWNGGPYALESVRPLIRTPRGWTVEPAPEPERGRLEPGELRRWEFSLKVPPDADPSAPYYLRSARVGDLYRWPDEASLRGLPHAPALIRATINAELGLPAAANGDGSGPLSVPLSVTRPARYRGVDKASGEFWRPIHVVPAVSVHLEPTLLVWPTEVETARRVSVTLVSAQRPPLGGQAELQLSSGWRAIPESQRFELSGEGSTATLEFELRAEAVAPAGDGDLLRVRAVARGDGESWDRSVSMIDYPHIERVPLVEPAELKLLRVPLEVRPRTVGYVMGSGDQGPEAIRQLGLSVDLLEPSDLRGDGFLGYDVIVLGVRAYEVRPDLAIANERLLEWVRAGGILIVQYNKYEFVRNGDFAPFPITMRRPSPRVTDESAPVTVLDPGSPIFTSPNPLDRRDFAGWVQERGLYFPNDWDPRYRALIETADEGETPLRGGLLVAAVGDGLYVHTSLSFFRQLPAGVPGAYRLFANLLSLDPAEWRAHTASG